MKRATEAVTYLSTAFSQWMGKVDALFVKQFGLSSEDFPDWNWRDAFEEGETAKEAFDQYCEDEDMTL